MIVIMKSIAISVDGLDLLQTLLKLYHSDLFYEREIYTDTACPTSVRIQINVHSLLCLYCIYYCVDLYFKENTC